MNPAATLESRGLPRADRRVLLLAIDTVAALLALTMALWVWSFTTGFAFDGAFLSTHARWLLAVPLWLAVVAGTRTLQSAHSVGSTIRGLSSAAGMALAVYIAFYFYAPPLALARLPALYFAWEAVLLTAAGRLIYIYALERGSLRPRVAILGSGARAEAARQLLVEARDVALVGAMTPEDIQTGAGDGLGELVIALDAPPSAHLVERLLRLQESGVEIVPFAAEYERRLERVPVEHLEPTWAFASLPEWARSRDASHLVKRALDITGALAGLAVLIVIALPVALAILAGSGRPVLFRQPRVGRAGRVFEVLKFRTMSVDAEADGAQFAQVNDPRVTAVGRWLRRSRLDELPQVLNVLRGDMSLVGPRPERPEFSAQLAHAIPFYRTRLMVAPGLTGWAQVNADYGDSPEAQGLKLEYDLYYIKHRSLLFDLFILGRTVGTVLGLRGR